MQRRLRDGDGHFRFTHKGEPRKLRIMFSIVTLRMSTVTETAAQSSGFNGMKLIDYLFGRSRLTTCHAIKQTF